MAMSTSAVRGGWQWGVVLVMVLSLTGCGHRATQGIQHGKKARNMPHSGAVQQGSQETLVSAGSGQAGDAFSREGYFPGQEGAFSGLLHDDPLVYEESSLANPHAGTPNDYWANRARAEELTAQSGLRDVLFEFDSYQLTDRAKEILVSNAEWIKAHPHAHITIEGHCDDRGTQAYNYVLGEKRALRTQAYLIGLGVDREQLQTMTFGKDNPGCRNYDESCFQKNRRAHLVLGVNLVSTVMPVR